MLLYKSNELIQLIATKFPHVFNVKWNLEHQARYIGKLDISDESSLLTTKAIERSKGVQENLFNQVA